MSVLPNLATWQQSSVWLLTLLSAWKTHLSPHFTSRETSHNSQLGLWTPLPTVWVSEATRSIFSVCFSDVYWQQRYGNSTGCKFGCAAHMVMLLCKNTTNLALIVVFLFGKYTRKHDLEYFTQLKMFSASLVRLVVHLSEAAFNWINTFTVVSWCFWSRQKVGKPAGCCNKLKEVCWDFWTKTQIKFGA